MGISDCYAYLDDLVIRSDNWADHVSVLRCVFNRLAKATLTLNLAKCEFGKATVTYLGKQVGHGQVRPLEAKVAAIVGFPAPTTSHDLRRFLGMAGYYRSFCRNFSVVVVPLTLQINLLSGPQTANMHLRLLSSYYAVCLYSPLQTWFKLEVDAVLWELVQFCCKKIPMELITPSVSSRENLINIK